MTRTSCYYRRVLSLSVESNSEKLVAEAGDSLGTQKKGKLLPSSSVKTVIRIAACV
jgi:hypothetical protein